MNRLIGFESRLHPKCGNRGSPTLTTFYSHSRFQDGVPLSTGGFHAENSVVETDGLHHTLFSKQVREPSRLIFHLWDKKESNFRAYDLQSLLVALTFIPCTGDGIRTHMIQILSLTRYAVYVTPAICTRDKIRTCIIYILSVACKAISTTRA